MKTTKTITKTSAAWAFVMSNHGAIERSARAVSAKTNNAVGVEELVSATIVRIVEKFAFDPSKGTAKTWIYWQARAVATDELRNQGTRIVWDRQDEPAYVDTYAVSANGAASIENACSIRRAVESMTDEEIEAVGSKVEEWDSAEIMERLGVSGPGRNQRLYRMRERLSATI